jgi:hypothetical protein
MDGDGDATGGGPSTRAAAEGRVAHPLDGWSNWVTFHDVCRRCGRRITGFVCDSGRLTRLDGDRWSVEMRWQHDGDGAVECDPGPLQPEWAATAALPD